MKFRLLFFGSDEFVYKYEFYNYFELIHNILSDYFKYLKIIFSTLESYNKQAPKPSRSASRFLALQLNSSNRASLYSCRTPSLCTISVTSRYAAQAMHLYTAAEHHRCALHQSLVDMQLKPCISVQLQNTIDVPYISH